MRGCGVLMHITSLPSPYGIGTFGAEAERFVDWLVSAKQKYWQVLPLSPTGYGDSPYQSFSTFAGNPLLIDLDELVTGGLLTKAQCESSEFGADPSFVDFEKVSKTKRELLKEAFHSFTDDVGFLAFTAEEAQWLDDYALFMAIKGANEQRPWYQWEKNLRLREPKSVEAATETYKEEIRFWKFVQYTFSRQWSRLRRYANKNGVKIIGDIPIYVALDSADVWASPELFELDAEYNPKRVAGVPPDYFSATGQLWGNPLYNWEYMRSEKYLWWSTRVKKAAELYDCLRIDHFRAFDTYYAVPFGEKTAEHGTWEKGPGIELFDAVTKNLGSNNNIEIIAEDLGEIFDSVKVLLKQTGFPGMRVLQFGFNPAGEDNIHLPHEYVANSVVYTGTHDNSTVRGWFRGADAKSRKMAVRYVNKARFESISDAFIRTLYASKANLAIIPAQDILGLYDNARMNIPSTIGGNWIWRVKPGALKQKHADKLAGLAGIYFR